MEMEMEIKAKKNNLNIYLSFFKFLMLNRLKYIFNTYIIE